MTLKCSLCETETYLYRKYKDKEYYRCPHCEAIQLHPNYYLDSYQEKTHYQTHINDVQDLRYQKFVSPIVNQVLKYHTPTHIGLDFGAGTGPVITKLLKDKDYNMYIYDPYFWDDKKVLNQKYDFIVCCEVAEHFYSPRDEFNLLRSLLNNKGSLIIMTDLYDDQNEFNEWYYKNDPTHVFFYTKKTFSYIKKSFGFNSAFIQNRCIHLFYDNVPRGTS